MMKLKDLLLPLSFTYGAVVNTRIALYRRNLLKSFDLQVKTISVGNITVGGTGKTPLVAYLAEKLIENGEKVCILTRGYGRDNPKERVIVSDGKKILADAHDGGDEPFELARKLSGKAVIIADANRINAGKWAKSEYGITTVILDDGFQHLQLKRKQDIVLLDATNPFGHDNLLPRGELRESVESLKRADIVVITRSNLVDNTDEIQTRALSINPNCQVFVSSNKFERLEKLSDFFQTTNKESTATNTPNLNYLAFCAIGNPDNFFEQLRAEKHRIVATRAFSDHHYYRQSDITSLENAAVASGVEALLTTSKDAVKLIHLKFNFPCFVIENGFTIADEPTFLASIVNR